VLSTLARYGTVGPIRDLVPYRIGASGRVVELEVIGAEGKMLLRGVKVRWGLGLPESLFVIGRETTPDGAVERFVITGFGRGHGVGLCQLGAVAMARSGASFVAILKYYYTGITLI
jgi:SpoIID/LytB domain protein